MRLEGSRTRSGFGWVLACAVALLIPAAAWTQSPVATEVPSVVSAPATDSGDAGNAVVSSAAMSSTSPATTGAHDYLAEVRANFTPENRSYWTTNVVLDLVGIVFGILVGMVFLFGGLSARIRDFAHARTNSRYLRMLIYFAIYSVLSFMISFPLAWYQGFALEHKYQLSTQSFGGWMGDELKGLLIGIVLFGVVPIVMLAYRAIERYKRWWVALAIGSIPLVIVATLIQPIIIDPMFNKFTPLKDQVLEQQILDLAARAGIPSRNVYQVDKSAQTKKFNAYVNGFGASQRIVLWDTTLKGMSTDEILFVMGHEMGHYRLGHIWRGIGFFSVLAFGLFFATGLLMSRAVARFGASWGFHELHDIASIPLFGLALSVVGLVSQPMVNAYSRGVEHQADTFGLEVTHTNDAAARAFIKLGSQNKSNPEPPLALEWFQYTHPPLLERVRYAIEYHPWTEGKPNQAFKP